MSNLAFLKFISRINNALGLEQLEAVVKEVKRADILSGMHSDLAPEAPTENMRSEWLQSVALLSSSISSNKVIPSRDRRPTARNLPIFHG